MVLVEEVYRITRQLPDTEKFGLTSQMRRSAVSIPSNIAEGHGRNGKKVFAQFLRISQGSLKELETQVMIAERLGFIAQADSRSLLQDCDEIGRMLGGLIRTVTQ